MKKHHKITAGIIALALVMSLCACTDTGSDRKHSGGGRSSGGDAKPQYGVETTEEPTETTEEPTTTTTEEPTTTTTTEATTTTTESIETAASRTDYTFEETLGYFETMVDVDIDTAVANWKFYMGDNLEFDYNEESNSYDTYRYNIGLYVDGYYFEYVSFFCHPDGGDVFEVSLGAQPYTSSQMMDAYEGMTEFLEDNFDLPLEDYYNDDNGCEYTIYLLDDYYLPEIGYYEYTDYDYYSYWYAVRSPSYQY